MAGVRRLGFWLLRLILDAPGTVAGFRRWVVPLQNLDTGPPWVRFGPKRALRQDRGSWLFVCST